METMQMQGLVEMENSGMVPLLRDDKLADLQRMYGLLRRVDGGLELMRNTMGGYLRETGRALVTDQERCKDPVEFVHTLLEEKGKYDRSVSQTGLLESGFLGTGCGRLPRPALGLGNQSRANLAGWHHYAASIPTFNGPEE